MFKRHTSRVRHRRQVIELQAKVVSPRIVWFGVLKRCRSLVRVALYLGLAAAAVWGVKYGIRRCLLENPDFRLQAIELTPNPALDERDLVRVAGIDLKASLFECDAAVIEDKLRALPEVRSARAHRDFPGTLVVEVVAREPLAWLAGGPGALPPRDPSRGLLVDDTGTAFSCPAGMLAEAAALPVIYLSPAGEAPAAGKSVVHPEFDRLVRLYKLACKELPGAADWIDSLRQSRTWALELVSRDGTAATFGLGDHERQLADLRAALRHARDREQQIASIELIPERNIPVVLLGEAPPRAIPVDDPAPVDRRSRDLQKLLNR
jgi:hypothetical protein